MRRCRANTAHGAMRTECRAKVKKRVRPWSNCDEKMTAEQRSETARKAARARWGAKKKGGRKRQ